jgi:DNA invertase Pin-like site-specific DNA recombinase
VSSDPRGAGRSVTEQEADCRATADREGWQVVTVLVDNDRSASRYATKTRPAFTKLLALIEAGGCDVVVCWEASRLQRDLKVFANLREACRERGVLWSYSGRTYDLSRTDDRLSTGLDAVLAERESDQTRERVMRAVRANAAAGRPHGKLLYGYRRDRDPATGAPTAQVIDDDQAEIVREAARRVARGEPCNAVAADFNARAIPAPRGGQWSLTQVGRLTTNPAYIAKRVHQGQVVGDATWPALLDEETFYACVARLSDPRRKTNRDGAIRHLLSGVAVCGVCGGPIRVQKNRGYPAYLCIERFCVSRKQSDVDELVEAVTVARLARPDVLDLLASDDGEDARAARAEVATKRARLDEAIDATARGELSVTALARMEARLLPEIEAAVGRAHRALVAPALRDVAGPDVAARWAGLPIAVRREVVSLLCDVRIMPAGRGARTFDPATIEITWKGQA